MVLEGKVALISGGSRGIGAATVRLFIQAGARVVFSYRQARKVADALVAECGGPERCAAIQQDLGSPADGRALVEASVAFFGRLDCLVANHGIWPPHDTPIGELGDEQWRQTLAVNLDAVFGLVQAAVARFDPQGPTGTGERGISSRSARPPGSAARPITRIMPFKGALISLTKSLSSELAPRGIRVNCVAPGWVSTEMSAGTLNDPELGPKIAGSIPMGRVAQPWEVARPVLFLCSRAGFISGEVLNVNGGAVLVG